MIFASIPPHPALRELVRDHLVAHFRFDPGAPVPPKRLSPRPEQGINFFLRGRPWIRTEGDGPTQAAPAVALFGQQTRLCDLQIPHDFLMLRVHFQPGALYRALRIPLAELGEEFFDAEAVLGPGVRSVYERLGGCGDYGEMVRVVEEYLRARFLRPESRIPPVDRAALALAGSPVPPALDRLTRQACLSPRQFHRSFTERMGVGPKLYSRLVRYHNAYRYKLAHPEAAWPAVALRFGYADYQHMVRDFRQFTGATPPEWMRADRDAPENTFATLGAPDGRTLPPPPQGRPILTTHPDR